MSHPTNELIAEMKQEWKDEPIIVRYLANKPRHDKKVAEFQRGVDKFIKETFNFKPNENRN